MLSRQCPFCENVNPPNAKFCNACGLKLHAALCPHCGAVNALTATSCIQCGEVLESPLASQPAAQAESATAQPVDLLAPAASQPVELEPHTAAATAEDEKTVFSVHFGRDHAATIDRYDLGAVRPGLPPPQVAANPALPTLTNFVAESPVTSLNLPTPQGGTPLVYNVAPKHGPPGTSAAGRVSHPVRHAVWGAAVVLVLLAGSTYFIYREHSRATLMGLMSASGGPPNPAPPSSADTAAADTEPAAAAANSGRPAVVPAAPAPPPERASVDRSTPPRPQVTSREAAAAVAAAAARPKAAAAGGTRPPQRFEPCTEAVAALGLCAAPTATPGRQ
jgi:hypothetical protein